MASKIRLYKKIFKTKLSRGENIRDHMDKMLLYFDQLTEMGIPLQQDLAVSIMLASLNEEYNSVTTAVEAWDAARLTMRNVKAILVEEYEKKRESSHDQEIMKVREEYNESHT